MKIYEFLNLNEQERFQSVWDKGVHIGTVTKNNLTCMLYSLGDFYVEVQYNTDDNKIAGLVTFKSHAEPLEAYLKNDFPGIHQQD